MGSALLSQWVEGPERITVVDPAGSDVPEEVTLVTDREQIADKRFDCIVAAVKPQLIDDIMADYIEHLAPGGYVLSIAAGYSGPRLSKLMGDAPVIRTMPNLPAAIGRGVSGIPRGIRARRGRGVCGVRPRVPAWERAGRAAVPLLPRSPAPRGSGLRPAARGQPPQACGA